MALHLTCELLSSGPHRTTHAAARRHGIVSVQQILLAHGVLACLPTRYFSSTEGRASLALNSEHSWSVHDWSQTIAKGMAGNIRDVLHLIEEIWCVAF